MTTGIVRFIYAIPCALENKFNRNKNYAQHKKRKQEIIKHSKTAHTHTDSIAKILLKNTFQRKESIKIAC